MSDDIFEIATAHPDVAELGQGYLDRVDGERILLPLPNQVSTGAAVRFIVHLVDGTPAFAGAGRCVQVSDQGPDVNIAERYETLIDSLTFDERSAPVYEYIVAVRQMAYSGAQHTGEPVQESVTAKTPLYVSEDTARYSEAVTVMSDDGSIDDMRDSEELLAPVAAVEALPASLPPQARVQSEPPPPDDDDEELPASLGGVVPSMPTPLPAALLSPSSMPAPGPMFSADKRPSSVPPPLPSVAPLPLSKGMLTRPALTAHWVPTAVRPARRGANTSPFQSQPGPLQIPGAPPRPELDRGRWVERAPSPDR
jgi:hypothetical protein